MRAKELQRKANKKTAAKRYTVIELKIEEGRKM